MSSRSVVILAAVTGFTMLGQALTELGRKHAAPRGLGEALLTRDDGYLIDPARILSRS